MMKITRIAILVFLSLIGTVVTLGASTQPKFRSSGSDAGSRRYLVTLAADADAEDLTATRAELVALYGARLDADAPVGTRQFAVTATAARARLLSSDPRVSEVIDIPATQPAPSAPPPARHFTPHTTGYGDNGQSGIYSYDSSGNITAIGADTYLYDAENRLTTSVTRGVTEAYTYDAFGNRKSATGATNCLGQTICAQPVAVSNTTNRLQTINGAAVHYDTPGNVIGIDAMTGSPATIYGYDGTEMMNESTVGTDDRQYVYTAEDERIAVKRGASWTWSVRDLNKKVLREFTSVEAGPNFAMSPSSRAWTKDYIWRDGLLLATTTSSGTLHYHLDHLGTPRLITDGNGVKIAEHAYYPFGVEINVTPHETAEEEMKFTGHQRDTVSGDGHTADYMHARYFSSSSGRFLSVDPSLDIRGALSKPQSWNRYTYVHNDPVDLADPTGRVAALITLASNALDEVWMSTGDSGNGVAEGAGSGAAPSAPATNTTTRTQTTNPGVSASGVIGFFVKFDGSSISERGGGRLFQVRFGFDPNKPVMFRLDFNPLEKGGDPKLHINFQQQGKGQRGFNYHVNVDPRNLFKSIIRPVIGFPKPIAPIFNPCMFINCGKATDPI